MTLVVVDTSAWYALINPHDAHHAAAQRFLQGYSGSFLTTNYVIAETTNLVLMRLGAERALEWLDLVRESQLVEVVCMTPEQHERIGDLFAQYAQKGLSFTDCSSLLLLQERKLSQAFCFDRDFLQKAGVACVP